MRPAASALAKIASRTEGLMTLPSVPRTALAMFLPPCFTTESAPSDGPGPSGAPAEQTSANHEDCTHHPFRLVEHQCAVLLIGGAPAPPRTPRGIDVQSRRTKTRRRRAASYRRCR